MLRTIATVATLAVSVGSMAAAQSGAVMPPPGPYHSSAPMVPSAQAPGSGVEAPAQPAQARNVQQMPYWMQTPRPTYATPQTGTGQRAGRANGNGSMQASGEIRGSAGFGGSASGGTSEQGYSAARPAYGAGISPGYFPGYIPAQRPAAETATEQPRASTVAPYGYFYRPQPYPASPWGGWGVPPFATGFWPQAGYGAPVYGQPYGYVSNPYVTR